MFDSGGFDQSGGFMPQGSFASPAEKQKSVRRQDNVFPLCIRQILEAPEDGLKFGSLGVHMVELVVIVRNVHVDTARVEYLLDDNTGGLNAIYWIERNEQTGEPSVSLPNVVENAYYRVYGTLRSLQGKKHVQVVRIMPITDLTELTTHILEVIHKPLLFQKLSCMESVKAPTSSMVDSGLSNSLMSSTIQSSSGFTPVQQKVFNVIAKSEQEIGIHRDDVIKQLGDQMSLKVLMNSLEFLSTEGHIYSTIDEDHYRATDI